MNGSAAEKLLNPNLYQVFLMANPSRLLVFTHPWFVVNRKGVVSRWAIGRAAVNGNPRFGWVNKDALPPFSGVPLLLFLGLRKPAWKGRLLGYTEGGEGSLAAQMADCIENSKDTYPYRDRYVPSGPNCNTYIQWVLAQFPDAGLKLPWNAVGKGYKAQSSL
ncbi:MAG TPA: DUF3750 domain-containing protein [Candidatus Paceibacterota bacterium]